MGTNQSIPTKLVQANHDGPARPRGREMRSLFWQLHPHQVSVRLHADAALCFGDVARVLLILHRDDAELDDDVSSTPPHPRNSSAADAAGTLHHLHPPGYRRLRLRDGMPEEGERALPSVIFSGVQQPAARQICHHSGLQRDSTLHVVMPKSLSPWSALPRPIARDSHNVQGCKRRGCWLLPTGWDDGLRETVANHDSLQLSGRSDLIARHLRKIDAHPHMRFVHQPTGVRALGQDSTDGPIIRLKEGPSINELISSVTDDAINDPPLDVFVALAVPPDSSLYSQINELVVHIQFPPTYPLAPERYRMLTPILHPLVIPYWNDGALFASDLRSSGNRDHDERNEQGHSSGHALCRDGGRMAFNVDNSVPSTEPADGLAWFLSTLYEPADCAKRFLQAHPIATLTRHLSYLRKWAKLGGSTGVSPASSPKAGSPMMLCRTELGRLPDRDNDIGADGVDDEIQTRVRLMGQLISNGMHWRPDLHAVCPAAFKREVFSLLLVRQRTWCAPMEIVWIIIDALLHAHLAGLIFPLHDQQHRHP